MSGLVRLRLAGVEARNLVRLIDEFLSVVGDPRAADDPGILRLTPSAYPEDDTAAADFREATRDALIDRRRADALVVRASLDSSTEAPQAQLALTPDEADAWMRTLAAMRLVVASRLGLDSADDHDLDDPRFGVYDWLGYRLEVIVRAADARDGCR